MATGEQMPLSEDQLNPTDRAVLRYLSKGRCTAAYIAEQAGYSDGNVRNRLYRLEEHGHVTNLGGGLWELVDDPRTVESDGTGKP